MDYFHGMSSKTTAYLRNNTTLNVLLGLSKRTSKTFFVALAKTYAGYCFAVNIYYSCKLKVQITKDRFLPFLTMSAQSRFSALPQLRHSPNFPYISYHKRTTKTASWLSSPHRASIRGLNWEPPRRGRIPADSLLFTGRYFPSTSGVFSLYQRRCQYQPLLPTRHIERCSRDVMNGRIVYDRR